MKKRLEADLISIAHKILQLKNKSDVNQLFLETQKLYEKLAVLRFVEEQYGETKPTIGQAAIVDDVETFYDNEDKLTPEVTAVLEENAIAEIPAQEPIQETISVAPEEKEEVVEEIQTMEEPIAETETEEIEEEEVIVADEVEEEIQTIEEPIAEIEEEVVAADEVEEEIQTIEEPIAETETEEIEEEVVVADEAEEEVSAEDETIEEKPETVTPPNFKPAFELEKEIEEPKVAKIVVETPKKPEAVQISFEDFLGSHYNEPQFVKVEDVPAIPKEPVFEAVESLSVKETNTAQLEKTVEKTASKVVSINDKFSKGIDIDLNDQIAFVKHLFGNSREDYNRVLSQLNTFDNFYETKSFIVEMVKPDYNDWKGKEDYEDRFMDIIEKKFL